MMLDVVRVIFCGQCLPSNLRTSRGLGGTYIIHPALATSRRAAVGRHEFLPGHMECSTMHLWDDSVMGGFQIKS